MNKPLLAACAILATSGAIVATLMTNNYYPSVKVTLPEGVTMTFVHQPLNLEAGCRSENENLLTILKQNCPQCTDIQTECLQRPQPDWHEGLQGQPTPHFTVYTEERITLIEGPQETAKATCEAILLQLQDNPIAACLPPKPSH